jgi:Flp pilus assembly protein TadD
MIFKDKWVAGLAAVRTQFNSALIVLMLACGWQLVVSPAQAKVKAYHSQVDIPTYPWWPAVKHPYFQGTDKRNIYPYPMLDNLSRQKAPRTWNTVVLENEYLRVTFLPELGGKIHEVLDKTTGQQMFYVNHVLKPGLIGQCGAWTSGGVEWNTGPQGHTVGCMQPVDVEILPPGPDGSQSVAIGEVERIYRTRWIVIVTLRPGRSFLEERIRIYNRTETIRPYYFWNCTAVPNPPGFQFIYPMTLGSDHGANQFFQWPIDHGKDLSRGANYQDASSIFAWHCDQDFFGSYDEDADRGVVAFANHYLLPGKKAWTWGHGGYGTMHQMDLTDEDGPYNEVQTGPLLTQADVGRLEPLEAVGWEEWWYPVHGIAGFTFANRDLAVNAALTNGQLQLRCLGTGTWDPVTVQISKDGKALAQDRCKISPEQPASLRFDLPGTPDPVDIAVNAGTESLARFRVPLDLPVRKPPAKKNPPQTASEFAQAGWQDYLFAKFPEAEKQFRQALNLDAKSSAAHTGLAFVCLARDPASAKAEAQATLAENPDDGLAHFALAVAEFRSGRDKEALHQAWQASLDPTAAVPGRALAAKLLLRQKNWSAAEQALSDPGPWQSDPVCRSYLALALFEKGAKKQAVALAEGNLDVDPLDAFARSLLWLARAESKQLKLDALLAGKAQSVLELVAEYADLNQEQQALRILQEFYLKPVAEQDLQPIPCYWAAYLASRQQDQNLVHNLLRTARALPADNVFPHRLETVPVLRWALQADPEDGRAALYLGHLLFSLGRFAEGREMWSRAVKLNAAPSIALRALGLASLTLDDDPKAALTFLSQAHAMDRNDAIVARDLARVLFALADKADSDDHRNELVTQARDTLQAAFPAGQGRSDFVSLLARAQNQLGAFDETARLLDSARITIWEGAREAHDLFEEAHLALGNAHLKAGRAAEALVAFNRALEYPQNLATGKLENTCESHIHYLRGQALAALGQKDAARAAWKKAADEPTSKDTKKEEARQKAKEALASAGKD